MKPIKAWMAIRENGRPAFGVSGSIFDNRRSALDLSRAMGLLSGDRIIHVEIRELPKRKGGKVSQGRVSGVPTCPNCGGTLFIGHMCYMERR